MDFFIADTHFGHEKMRVRRGFPSVAAMDEALACKRTGKKKRILFGLTGTGYFDMTAYKQYNDGTMSDSSPTEEELERGFASIPRVPAAD